MKQDELKNWIEELIREGQLWKFYKSKEWITLKEGILQGEEDDKVGAWH